MKRRFACHLLISLILFSELAFAREKDEEVVRAGQDYTIAADATAGDIVMLGGTLRVEGTVNGDLAMFGGTALINGRVKGDVAKFGGYTRLSENSFVGGDLAQIGGELDRAPDAQVRGEVEYKPGKSILTIIFLVGLVASIPFGIAMALLGYAILRPQRISVMADAVNRDLGLVLATGSGTLAVAIVLVVLVTKAHVSHPLRDIIMLLLVVTSFVGYAGVSAWIGRKLFASSGPLAVVVLGALVVSVVQAIPLVGVFAFLIFLLMALGIALTTGFGTAPEWFRRVA